MSVLDYYLYVSIEELKGIALQNFAWLIYNIKKNKDNQQLAKDFREDYNRRFNSNRIDKYLKQADNKYYRCDPFHHIKGT